MAPREVGTRGQGFRLWRWAVAPAACLAATASGANTPSAGSTDGTSSRQSRAKPIRRQQIFDDAEASVLRISNVNGTASDQGRRLLEREKAHPAYVVWAAHPEKCWDVVGEPRNGALLRIWDCPTDRSRSTKFLIPSDGRGRIRWAEHPDFCLHTPGRNSLLFWKCSEVRSETTAFIIRPSGDFTIRSANYPGMCMDVPRNNVSNGHPLQLWECGSVEEGGSVGDESFRIHLVHDYTWEEWQHLQHPGRENETVHRIAGDALLPQVDPSHVEVPRFNCDPTADSSDSWPEKTAWCCDLEGIGCSTTVAPDYDCTGAVGSWNSSQRSLCCMQRGIGCATSPPTIVHKPFACDVHEKAWSQDQKEWCCRHEDIGCRGCQAECVIEGVAAPCWNYIQWMALRRYQGKESACELSHRHVLDKCMGCATCGLKDACRVQATPAPTLAAVNNGISKKIIRVSMVVENLDYAQLTMSSMLFKFEDALRELIASKAGNGIQPEHLMLDLSLGSVNVVASTGIPENISESSIAHMLTSTRTALESSAAETVARIPGIHGLMTGNLRVNNIRVEQTTIKTAATSLAEPPSPALSASAPVGVQTSTAESASASEQDVAHDTMAQPVQWLHAMAVPALLGFITVLAAAGYYYRDSEQMQAASTYARERTEAGTIYCRTHLEAAAQYCRTNANDLYARRLFVQEPCEELQMELHGGADDGSNASPQVWRMVRIVDKQRPYAAVTNGTSYDVELDGAKSGTPRRAALTAGGPS